MFNLFRKKNSFPPETQAGNIYIKNDQLFYEDHGNQEHIELSKLKYAYVEVLGDRPFLFLFDHRQHYILIAQKGFSETYLLLSKRFGFDDETFFKVIHQKKEIKSRIWIQQHAQNYQVLSTDYQDFTLGFEVQCMPPKFVSWDTTYHEFPLLEIGNAYQSEYGSIFKIDHPVRIGSLLIDELEFNTDNDQKNIAVQCYFANLYNKDNTDGSYNDLRNLWMDKIPTDPEEAGFEREDQKHLYFEMDGLNLTFTYTYDKNAGYDDGSTYLGINNNRNYAHTLLKRREDLQLDSTTIITFKSLLDFLPQYQNNSKVTAIPDLIKEHVGHHQAFWLDISKRKFGFTGDQSAIEYVISEIAYITIQNVLPAKGGGYAELIVQPKSGYPENIYYAELNSLDSYAEEIQALLGIPVEMPEPYYNC